VTAGCRTAGIPRRSYYDWLTEDEAFAKAVDATREEVLDNLEEEMFKRAREKSDLLMLKHNRDRYRETPRIEVVASPSGAAVFSFLDISGSFQPLKRKWLP
jgi:hypothetical protein